MVIACETSNERASKRAHPARWWAGRKDAGRPIWAVLRAIWQRQIAAPAAFWRVLSHAVRILPLFAAVSVLAADQPQPTLRGLLTLTPGYLTAQKTTTYGVGGELEFYPKGSISLRTDGYALVGKSADGGLKQNYQGFLGIAYNFEKWGPLTPFAGFQPGFGLSQIETPGYDNFRLMPVFSPFAGVHYFSEAIFHFTLNVRYVYGELLYPNVGAVSMSEIRISFGLGAYL